MNAAWPRFSVGVQGLGAGHGQDHTAQHEIAGGAVVDHEPRRPGRGQSLEDGRVLEDLAEAENADYGEPDEDHRAEQPSDRSRPEPLQHEQREQDRDRQWHDQVGQRRGGDLDPLN